MRDYAQEALGFLANRQPSDLETDRLLSLATIKAIEVIGEAANNVSKETQQRFSSIPWRTIIAMRHRTIHGYVDIHPGTRRTVKEDLPALIEELNRVIAVLKSEA